MKKKYWIVSQLFYPDETSTGFVITKIAEKIADMGEIEVICGPANYHSAILNSTTKLDERIKITRINNPQWNKNNLVLRTLSFLIFTIGVFYQIIFKVKKKDILIVVTNPPTLIVLLAFLKKFKDFKMFVILQDIFPENLAVTGILKKKTFVYKYLLKTFNSSYNKADHLIACGEDMKKMFVQKTEKIIPISVVTNWADHNEIFEQTDFDRNQFYQRDLSNKVVLQFAGNIGRVQGLDKFLEEYKRADNKDLYLIIIGDGAFKERLLQMQKQEKIANVLFLPPKPRAEQNDFLNSCDIGLVTLSEGMYGLGVPSKVYNIFAAGKPVFYIGDTDSEIYHYIKDYDVGWAFNWSESDKIRMFLKGLTRKHVDSYREKGLLARRLVEEKFTRDYVLEKYKEILSSQ